MLHHKSRSACGEIIHVRQILAELLPLTLRIFTHFSLSSQLLLRPCMAGMLHYKSRSACGEIIHVQNILAVLLSLTLRIFTHFSLFSQLLLHRCMDLNETWQKCCATSLDKHVEQYFMFYKFCRSHGSWNVCLIILLPLWNKLIAGHMFYKYALCSSSKIAN